MFVAVEELNDIYALDREGNETLSGLAWLCEEYGMRESVMEECLFVSEIAVL